MPERSSKSSEVYTLSLMASLTGSTTFSLITPPKPLGGLKKKNLISLKKLLKICQVNLLNIITLSW